MNDPIAIMVAAGHKWHADNPDAKPSFSVCDSMPGAIFTDNSEADELNMVMVDAAEAEGHLVSDLQVNNAITQLVYERVQTSPIETPEGDLG